MGRDGRTAADRHQLASATTQTLDILGNSEVIAVDQDSLGKQGVQVSDTSGLRVLAKKLANGDVAVAFFNETGSTANITTDAKTVGLASSTRYIPGRPVGAHVPPR